MPYANTLKRSRANAKKTTHRAICSASHLTREQAIARRVELRQDIRQAHAALSGSLRNMPCPAWSPVRSWQSSLKSSDNAAKRRAEAELAAIEDRFPTPGWWEPRKASPADKRIAKQYSEAETPMHETLEANLIANGIRCGRYYEDDGMSREDAVALADCGIVPRPENELDEPRYWQPAERAESYWSDEFEQATRRQVA
jgi:hypothetical protein